MAPAVLGWFRSHRMADPEGLTGDVFVSVARGLASFEGDDDALRRWVFTIARNRRVDAIRQSQRRPIEVGGDVAALDSDLVDEPAADPIDPVLIGALGRLTEEQREVVVLRIVADLPIADVAEITGRSPGSVKMLAARGLEALRNDPSLADSAPP